MTIVPNYLVCKVENTINVKIAFDSKQEAIDHIRSLYAGEYKEDLYLIEAKKVSRE